MTDKKFTDEVIKALEKEIHLAEYVDSDYCCNTEVSLLKSALDLINRQKAEIERLNSANDEKFRQWYMLAEKTKQHYADLYEEAKNSLKAEAYKEFAERLKERKTQSTMDKRICTNEMIENLLKEMVGEDA